MLITSLIGAFSRSFQNRSTESTNRTHNNDILEKAKGNYDFLETILTCVDTGFSCLNWLLRYFPLSNASRKMLFLFLILCTFSTFFKHTSHLVYHYHHCINNTTPWKGSDLLSWQWKFGKKRRVCRDQCSHIIVPYYLDISGIFLVSGTFATFITPFQIYY